MGKKPIPLDYFSVPIQGFNIKGEETSKSWLGFVGTLIFFGIVLGVLITGLISMFQRQAMTVSTTEEGVPSPPVTNIQNITIAFGVTNRLEPLQSLTYGTDFIIWAELLTYQYTDTTPRQLQTTTENIPLMRCTKEYFGSIADIFYAVVSNFDDMFCIPREDKYFTLEGTLGSDVYKEIRVGIACGGDATASSCPPWYVTGNIMFYYADSNFDATNYEQPVSQTPTAFVDHADNTSYREKGIWITEREVITDTGLIFSDLESQTDLLVSVDQTIIETLPVEGAHIYSFYIRLDKKKITVNREYSKILDVLATTTGIASTIALIFRFILIPYIELNTHNDIMKAVAPERYTKMNLNEYMKALTGNKAAKAKLKKVQEDKEWIANNLDTIKMIRNWNDLEKIKNLILVDEKVPLRGFDNDGNSLIMEKKTVQHPPELEFQDRNSFSLMEKSDLIVSPDANEDNLHSKYVS